MKNDSRTKLIIKNIFVLAMLVFFAPIGMLLMWNWTNWPKWIKVTITLLFVIPALLIIFTIFIGQLHKVIGQAMMPTYKNGQYVFENKLTYRNMYPKRGDIVIFEYPIDPKQQFIKRVVGLPEEKIRIKSGKVYINDSLLNEPYLAPGTTTNLCGFLKDDKNITIPANNYFVLGDNRDHSSDSRCWGFVSREKISGKIQ